MERKVDIDTILKENKVRTQTLFTHYDPETGIGSPLERFEMPISEDFSWYLPMEMMAVPSVQHVLAHGSLQQYMGSSNIGVFLTDLAKIRVTHDFEFWAYTCVKLWDKINKQVVPFLLRRPQREALIRLEEMRKKDMPIRMIILKARQWGGSTLVQMYMAWIQLFRKRNWHSAIIADVDDQARHIRGMFTRFAKLHPVEIMNITFRPYEGSQKIRYIEETGCIVGVGSVKQPESLRSYDFAMVHMSEVGMWKSTPMQKAEDLAQAIRGSISYEPYTMIVMESTAKGVGNFFHDEWVNATNGNSSYIPLFVPWFEVEIYQRKIDDYQSFIEKMNEYDWFCWDKGANLEGINWYKTYKAAENRDDLNMFEEFPTTPEEAFQSTGRRAFNPFYVLAARKNCIEPVFKGDIVGDAVKGKDAFRNLRLEKNPNGNLWIWSHPMREPQMVRRYCSFGDVGGRSKGADYSILKVFDRYWMTDGGVPEVAAVWHGHSDQDLFAWKAAQISWFYNKALMAIESNSLRKENASAEGEHFLTVLDEIAPYYENLFARIDPEKIRQGAPVMYGFHTNVATKPMLIDGLNGALRDTLYLERDSRACDEFDYYEIREDGSYGAVEGKHDDHVIATAGNVWLSYKHMEMPMEIKETAKAAKKPMTEATF